MPTRPSFAVALVLGACMLASGCKGRSETEEAELPDDVPGLIEALASPNFFPPAGGYEIVYPEGFDHRAQERVRLAEKKLREKGFEAVPYLVEHLEDIRYSYSERFDTWHNHALGEVCFYLIEDVVDFYGCDYEVREGADGKTHEKPSYLWSICMKGEMREWWEQRQTRPLHELRIEALQWTIAEERRIGFKDNAEEQRIMGPLLERLEELGGWQ